MYLERIDPVLVYRLCMYVIIIIIIIVGHFYFIAVVGFGSGKCVRVCAWMRGCVRACMGAYVRGSGCATRGCGVRACVYAQIEGMVVFYFILLIGFYGVGRVGRGRGRTWPGPMMVPFQLDMRISSLSSRP